MSAAFDAQAAVRMDAEQLDQYMKELFSWSKEMKAKEASSKSRQQGTAAARAAQVAPPPPPVNPAGSGGSQRPSSAGTSSSREPRHPAAHTYEHYRAKWDQFDVDAALAEAEDGSTAAPSPSNGGSGAPARPAGAAAPGSTRGASSAPVDIPAARVTVPVASTGAAGVPAPGAAAPTSAEGWKDAGNAHFKAGRLQQAEACYSRSLELAPSCLAHANRAMARLKLGRLAEAEADCTAALALEPLYVKAYQRRAVARQRLGNLLGAIEDCEGVLRLEPNNKQAAADREQWAAELLAEEGLPGPSRFEQLPLAVAAAPAVGPAATATRPEGEALITEVSSVQRQQHAAAAADKQQGPLAAAAADGAAQAPAAVSLPMATIQVMRSSSGGSRAGDEDDEAIPDLPAEVFELPVQTQLEHQAARQIDGQPGQVEEQQQQQQQQQAAAQPAQQALHQAEVQEQQQQQQNGVKQQPGTASQAKATPAAASAVPAMEQIAAPQLAAEPLAKPEAAALSAAGGPEPAVRAAVSPAPLKVPRTGVEFEKGWRALKGDPHRQAAYLLALAPAALPALLKQALTPALLAAAAGALLQHGLVQAPEPTIALLQALPGVPRFDLNLLSVPQRQRAELVQAWDGAAAQVASSSSGCVANLAAQLAEARQRWKL